LIDYFDYVIEIVVIILLAVSVGSLLLTVINFSHYKQYTITFIALLSGILLLTIVQAIAATKFNTILLIAPIILSIGYYLDQNQLRQKYNDHQVGYCGIGSSGKYFVVIEVLILAVIFYSIKFFSLFQNGDPNLLGAPGHGDFEYYSRCADYMLRTGIETCNNDYLFEVGNKPYHFADLWFISLITNINNNITYFSSVFTFRSIYLVVIYLGIMAILENKYPLDYKIKVAVVLSVFFAPLYIDAYASIRLLSDAWLFTQTFFESPKLFFIQLLIIASVLLNIIGHRKLGIATLLLMPVLYTVVIIPVFAGFTIYLIYAYYINKKLLYDELMISVISATYIILYYFMINPSGAEKGVMEINLLELVNFGHTINIIGGTVLSHMVLYFPVSLIFIIYVYYNMSVGHLISELKQSPLYVFLLAMPVFGLMLWSVTSGDVNAVQLFGNIAMPIFYTGSIFIILLSFVSLSRYYRVLVFSFLLVTAFHELPKFSNTQRLYDADFIREVKSRSATFNNVYVTYKPVTYYDSIFSFYEKSNNFGSYFAYLKNNSQPVSLDMIDVPIVGDNNYKRMVSQALKASTYYRYVNDKKKRGIIKSNSEYQLDFIKENRINVLVTLKSVKLPDHLNALVVDRIEDSASGEVVCILNGAWQERQGT